MINIFKEIQVLDYSKYQDSNYIQETTSNSYYSLNYRSWNSNLMELWLLNTSVYCKGNSKHFIRFQYLHKYNVLGQCNISSYLVGRCVCIYLWKTNNIKTSCYVVYTESLLLYNYKRGTRKNNKLLKGTLNISAEWRFNSINLCLIIFNYNFIF